MDLARPLLPIQFCNPGASCPPVDLLCNLAGFGQQQAQPSFGVQQQQQTAGSKNVPYQKVSETEGSANQKNTVYLCSMVSMPQFQPPNEKQYEELRAEDYQVHFQDRELRMEGPWSSLIKRSSISRHLLNCESDMSQSAYHYVSSLF